MHLPASGGTLKVSVQDALDADRRRSYIKHLRRTLPVAQALPGMERLGFPPSRRLGQVVLIKDGKTLLVDAAALSGKASLGDTPAAKRHTRSPRR